MVTDMDTQAAREMLEAGGATDVTFELHPKFGWQARAYFGTERHGADSRGGKAFENSPEGCARALLAVVGALPPEPAGLELGAELLEAEREAGHGDLVDVAFPQPAEGGDHVTAVVAPVDHSGADEDSAGSPIGDLGLEPRDIEPAEPDQPAGSSFPGTMLLPDDLAAARDKAIALITAKEEEQLDALREKLDRAAETIRDYLNLTHSQAPTVTQAADYAEACAIRDSEHAIAKRARDLRRAARTADLDTLKAMLAEL